jgi:hypothetical protein
VAVETLAAVQLSAGFDIQNIKSVKLKRNAKSQASL